MFELICGLLLGLNAGIVIGWSSHAKVHESRDEAWYRHRAHEAEKARDKAVAAKERAQREERLARVAYEEEVRHSERLTQENARLKGTAA